MPVIENGKKYLKNLQILKESEDRRIWEYSLNILLLRLCKFHYIKKINKFLWKDIKQCKCKMCPKLGHILNYNAKMVDNSLKSSVSGWFSVKKFTYINLLST